MPHSKRDTPTTETSSVTETSTPTPASETPTLATGTTPVTSEDIPSYRWPRERVFNKECDIPYPFRYVELSGSDPNYYGPDYLEPWERGRKENDAEERGDVIWNSLTDEFREAYGKINYDLSLSTGVVPHLDREEYNEMAHKGREDCPFCFGTKKVDVLSHSEETGLEIILTERCVCILAGPFWQEYRKLLKQQPRFAKVRLNKLKPSPLSTLPPRRQQEILDHLKADDNDEHSYLFSGPPGTGKTTLLVALYLRVLRSHLWDFLNSHEQSLTPVPSVWRVNTAELLDQHVAWETRSSEIRSGETPVKQPDLTIETIRACIEHGLRPAVFLDEIDKIKLTEFKANRLLGIIDVVYNAEGQIVASSNLSAAELIGKWGVNEGGSIIRRITQGEKASEIRFI